MSLNGSLGAGMASVAGNAMLADSIVRQASALADAQHSLDAMTKYAAKLEGIVRQLHMLVVDDGRLIDAMKEDLDSVKRQRNELTRANRDLAEEKDELQARIDRLRKNGIVQYEKFDRQVAYMRDLKNRLLQTERALQHASGLAAAGEVILDRLIEIDSERADEHRIEQSRAYTAFCASGRLVISDESQRLLEALKAKAPDFKEGVAN